MNNFTKEELIQIQEAMHYWHEGMQISLTGKIQFMIDNYETKTIEVWHCEKCGHVQ